MNKNNLVLELNKIASEEMKPKWYWVCMFCGKKSDNGNWMKEHIESHCRKMAKENDYGLLEGEWEEHTLTVEPNMSAVYSARVWLGLPLSPNRKIGLKV